MLDSRMTGVARIGCFGDSLMYGLGVRYDSTLPSRLEHHLSQIFPDRLFFVENRGIPGANLFDASSVVRDELERGRFDAMVLSVCNNDASLFEKSIGLSRFPNNVHGFPGWRGFWSNMMPAVRWQMEALRELSKTAGVPLIVVWLGYRSEDVPIVALMSDLCLELGLPFVDSVEPCVRMFGVDAHEELSVSSIDVHHFNGRGLDLVAKHLALALRRWQVLPNDVVCSSIETLPCRLEEAVRAMTLAGKSPLFWGRWALRMVSSKTTVLMRSRDTRFSTANRELIEMEATIRGAVLLCLSELSRALTASDWELLHEAACHLAAADELSIGALIPTATGAHEELVRRIEFLSVSSQAVNLECFQRDIHLLNAVAATAATIRQDCAFVRAFNQALDRAIRLGKELHNLISTDLSYSNRMVLSAALFRFGIAVSQLRSTMATLEPGMIRTAAWEDDFFTTVQIHVNYPRNEQQKPVFIYVSVIYDEPAMAPVRDFIWVECTSSARHYELQFPLVLRGRLYLNLEGQEHCREGLAIVEKIVILNSFFGANILWEPAWGKSLLSCSRSREITVPFFAIP